MSCQTRLGKEQNNICGHPLGAHEGEESGELMGEGQPCTLCPCSDFTSAAWTSIDETGVAKGKAQNVRVTPKDRCDGEHAMPECADPQCWHRDPPEVKTITKWADPAMFTAEPIKAEEGPRVYLLWATPDPLAAIAAACKMYKGEVVRSFADVTHAERQSYYKEILKTKLQAPFEFVKFHFMIEGVTRAFTHQMVRQRTAVYAQESLRFAVKEDMPVGLPPSLAGTESTRPGHRDSRDKMEQRMRAKWDRAIRHMERAYDDLIAEGMPAEDARGLLPHNTLTRLHYSTDLRALLDHAGNRLCTQAQFEWRLVFARIAEAIRQYNPYAQLMEQSRNGLGGDIGELTRAWLAHVVHSSDQWQYEALAGLFKPVCYATGKCEFKANFDRACSIRDRVDAFHANGVSSDQWEIGGHTDGRDPQNPRRILPIRPVEWLANPGAAR